MCITPDRLQSKKLSTIDKRRSKINRNSVLDCHLSPVGRQMTIENTVSIDLWSMFLDSIDVLIAAYPVCVWEKDLALARLLVEAFTWSLCNTHINLMIWLMLAFCMLGNFFMLLFSSSAFWKLTFFQIFFSGALSECQMVWVQITTKVLWVLIWVQTVCKGYQLMTKVSTSK